MKLKPVHLAIALALASMARLSPAQEYPSNAMVAVVEVVASAPLAGLGIDRNLLPYPVQTANGDAIRQAGSGNLSDFMARNLNGVNINEISGSPFQNDITYRGFRASPVLGASQGISVYLDGVRVNEPFGDVVNWDMVPEAAIGSVLLVPGANPLYGLNTLGGALALSTRSGLTHPGGDAELSVSDTGRRRLDVSYGMRGADHWHSFIGTTLFDDAGWREHSPGRTGNVLLKVGRSNDATDWSVSLLGGASRLRGNGLLPSYRWVDDALQPGLYEDNRRASYTFPDLTRNRLVQTALNVAHRFDANTELAANVYARNSRRDTVNGDVSDLYDDYVEDCGAGFDAGGAAIDPDACGLTRAEGAALHPAMENTTSTRQQSQGANTHLSARRGRHRLESGLSFDRSTVRFAQFEQYANLTPARGVVADPGQARAAASSVTGSSRAFGVYGADTWEIAPATHLSASARLNRAQVNNTLTTERGPQPGESFTYTSLNPALGVTRQFGARLTIFGNVARNNRVPTVIELGCADPAQPCRLPVGLQSDPYLKQVIARTVEGGVRWQAGATRFAASLYRTVNRDDILFLSSGPSRQGYFSNFAQTRHQGADLALATKAGALAVRASYSYLDASYDAEGELFTGARNVQVGRGTRIAGLPEHTLKLGLDWKVTPAFTLGADAQAVSDLVTQGNEDGLREDPEPGQPLQRADWRIGGHALLNLRASWRADQHWELFARISNVFDRRYESFGAIATDLFPNGRQLQPHEGAVEAGHARFVAPGAPRTVAAGLRYRF
ncbi:MAG TPA: TonB-dependent receptor [Telluria sp.]